MSRQVKQPEQRVPFVSQSHVHLPPALSSISRHDQILDTPVSTSFPGFGWFYYLTICFSDPVFVPRYVFLPLPFKSADGVHVYESSVVVTVFWFLKL